MSGEKEVDYRKEKLKSRIAWAIAIFFACAWLVVTLVPFFFMIMNSFRKQFDMLAQGVFHLPDPWYFNNYVEVMTRLLRLFLPKCACRCRFIDSDAGDFRLCRIPSFPNEIQAERFYLCRNRGNDVHPHACDADPHF